MRKFLKLYAKTVLREARWKLRGVTEPIHFVSKCVHCGLPGRDHYSFFSLHRFKSKDD